MFVLGPSQGGAGKIAVLGRGGGQEKMWEVVGCFFCVCFDSSAALQRWGWEAEVSIKDPLAGAEFNLIG